MPLARHIGLLASWLGQAGPLSGHLGVSVPGWAKGPAPLGQETEGQGQGGFRDHDAQKENLPCRPRPDRGLSAHQAGSLQTGLCTQGPRDSSRRPPSPHGGADPGSMTAEVLGLRHEVHIRASDTWGWPTGGCLALGCRGKSPDGRTRRGHPRGPTAHSHTARAGSQDGGQRGPRTPFQNQAPHLAVQAEMRTRDPGPGEGLEDTAQARVPDEVATGVRSRGGGHSEAAGAQS